MIETKRRSTILNVVLTAIILVIGVLFWPGKEKFNQSNPRDVNKTQIRVKVKALNIRKEATVDSADIGTVYQGEIFTVLDRIDNEDYYWYQIKTKQGIKGYLASDRNSEYVEVISGLVDREPPKIIYEKEVLLFVDGKENYEEITCEDNYTKCELSYDNSDKEFIKVTAKDEAGNESTLDIRYYNVYNVGTLYSDSDDNVHFTITTNGDNDKYYLWANYIANKDTLDAYKSNRYSPVIDLFDEEFNRIDGIPIAINKEAMQGSCINDKNNNLKEPYLEKDITKGSMLCMNYTFSNVDSKVKYFAIGFNGIENSDIEENNFSSYYSKYFILS